MPSRYALVIGVSQYTECPLSNAVVDAGRAANALRRRGFEATLIEDSDASTLDAAIKSFSETVVDAEIALIYLAGHAVERHGAGYFLPSDFPFPLSPSKAKHYGISLNDVINATKSARSGVVVLDACRNWPADPLDQAGLNSDIDQLATEERTWRNVLLAYSTSSSAIAGDGIDGEGSLFCQAFCRYILDHSLDIDECFRLIAQDVIEKSQLRQQPWTYSSLQRSISFSDLPRFKPLQRHVLPYAGHGMAAWCVPDSASQGVFAGLGEMQAWHVDLAGRVQVGGSGSAKLVGAADIQGHLFLAGNGGEIFVEGDRDPVMQIPVEPSFGLVASPDRLGLTHFGNRTATIFRLTISGLTEIARVNTDFYVYCCVYLENDIIWLAGENGKIVELNLTTSKPSQRQVAKLTQHINAMAIAPGAESIFCAGQSSLLTELDKNGNTRKTLLEQRRPQTAAGVRSALVNIALDDVIREFIFNRSMLPVDTLEAVYQELGFSSLVSCAHAPGLPVLAVGTDESTVVLFDTRDAQIIQEIDISTGHPGAVAGLLFLSDCELVVIGPEGQVLFLSA